MSEIWVMLSTQPQVGSPDNQLYRRMDVLSPPRRWGWCIWGGVGLTETPTGHALLSWTYLKELDLAANTDPLLITA